MLDTNLTEKCTKQIDLYFYIHNIFTCIKTWNVQIFCFSFSEVC